MATTMDLSVATRALYERFLREMAGEALLRWSVLRGRITPTRAWMRIVVAGEPGRIDALRRRWTSAAA